MGTHVILGAGAIGRGAARELVAAGHDVLLVSRSGGGADLHGVQVVAADVTDGARLVKISAGADSIVNALNPSTYSGWAQLWPPMASAILEAATATGAGLVTVGNLYPYGRVAAPMTEETPVAPNGRKGEVRAAMWRDALALHEAMAQVAAEVAALVGQPVRRPRRVPTTVVRAVSFVYPLLREFNETRHQFEAPFVLDSTAASTAFGLAATPWESTLRESVAWLSETAA